MTQHVDSSISGPAVKCRSSRTIWCALIFLLLIVVYLICNLLTVILNFVLFISELTILHLPNLALSCRLCDSLTLHVAYLITFLLHFFFAFFLPSIISIFLTPLISIPLLIPLGSVRYYIRVLLSIRQIIICRI